MVEVNETTKWIARLSLGLLVSLNPLWVLPKYSLRAIMQKREVEKVVQGFHEAYNTRRPDELCEVVSGCSLSSPIEKSWNFFLQKVQNQAGEFRKQESSDIETNSTRLYISATYVSYFEKTKCTEIFHLTDRNDFFKGGAVSHGPLRILDYQVFVDGKRVQ